LASIRITITGGDALQRKLKQLADAAGSLKPVFNDFGEYMVLTTRDRFDRETGPDGEPWQPLNSATAQRKARRNKNPKILQQNSILRDSITYEASDDQLEVGTNLIYGPTHQFGDPDRNIPARPFLGINDDDASELEDLIGDYLDVR